jgi:hypothetical protein
MVVLPARASSTYAIPLDPGALTEASDHPVQPFDHQVLEVVQSPFLIGMMDPRQHVRPDGSLGIVEGILLEDLAGLKMQQTEHNARGAEIDGHTAEGAGIRRPGQTTHVPDLAVMDKGATQAIVPSSQQG